LVTGALFFTAFTGALTVFATAFTALAGAGLATVFTGGLAGILAAALAGDFAGDLAAA
jgi:hypothetical protein